MEAHPAFPWAWPPSHSKGPPPGHRSQSQHMPSAWRGWVRGTSGGGEDSHPTPHPQSVLCSLAAVPGGRAAVGGGSPAGPRLQGPPPAPFRPHSQDTGSQTEGLGYKGSEYRGPIRVRVRQWPAQTTAKPMATFRVAGLRPKCGQALPLQGSGTSIPGLLPPHVGLTSHGSAWGQGAAPGPQGRHLLAPAPCLRGLFPCASKLPLPPS